jgi:signal transduction histidine kinase
MRQPRPEPKGHHLLTVSLEGESSIVAARQRARQLAQALGYDHQDQIRIATATSEIARNAVQYGRDGRIQFCVDFNAKPPSFVVVVSDEGPGIEDAEAVLESTYQSRTGMGVGISGTRKLMDRFSIESVPGAGTAVTFSKFLPAAKRMWEPRQLAHVSEQLTREAPLDGNEELRRQNQELLLALNLLRARESELEKRRADTERLNQELAETNQGVVALYAELDERATALRRADEVKTRFLSYMSHEFRTPLNSILALSDLLLRRVDGELTTEQEKQISFVRAAANELFDMVNDLLDIAKVEAGKVDMRIGPVELTKLFGALRGMMRPVAQSGKTQLIFEDPNDGPTVMTDEGKVAQILRNLISNALKFTEAGEVRVGLTSHESELAFWVKDTGIGIAAEDLERIFHEFAQIENPVQRKVRGTGLGLPLSRRLAGLLGGTLTAVSSVGEGSTFTLTLPLTLADANEKTESAPRHKPDVQPEKLLPLADFDSSPGSVLLIDDDHVARYIARQWFRTSEYTITEASGGVEGLERARFDHPSLIVLDIGMPDRSGFDVLDELKSDPATKDIPVVIHTSRVLNQSDLARLSGRHVAVLPKQVGEIEPAMTKIRELLKEPPSFLN